MTEKDLDTGNNDCNYLGDVLVAPGTDGDEEGHVAVLTVEALLLGVDRHLGPGQAEAALGAGEVLLVVELVPGLHGPVGDGLGADGAGHDGHCDWTGRN